MNSETNTAIQHPVVDLHVAPPNFQANELPFHNEHNYKSNACTVFSSSDIVVSRLGFFSYTNTKMF